MFLKKTKQNKGVIATFYLNNNNKIYGFRVEGETNYAKRGYDILASAISVLVINTANSITALTSDEAIISSNTSTQTIECTVENIKCGKGSKEAHVLLESLDLGLKGIIDNYGEEYIQIKYIRG